MKKLKLFLLLMLLSVGIGARAAAEIKDGKLTVYDGTATNAYVPVYGFYMDAFCRSQYIIPEEELVNMVGKTVKGLKYYGTKGENYSYGASMDVYLMIAGNTEFSPAVFADKKDAELVYTGDLNLVVNGETGQAEWLIIFDKPFNYAGGNLLIGVENTTEGSYSSNEFYGTEMGYASAVSGYNYSSLEAVSATVRQFIPKTTFFVEDAGSGIAWEVKDGVLTISGIGDMDNYASVADAPWYGERNSFTSVVIENGITGIGDFAFGAYTKLVSVSLPSSLTRIGANAFDGDYALESLTLPASLKTIGNYAFWECTGLPFITSEAVTPPTLGDGVFNFVNPYIPVFVPAKSVDAYKADAGWSYFENIQANVPDYIIGGIAYEFNTSSHTATVIALPDGVKYDGDVSLPEQVNYKGEDYTVTAVDNHAFYDCDDLTSIFLPATIQSIGTQAFAYSDALSSVFIPASVTEIGAEAFAQCDALTAIDVASDNTVYASNMDGVLFTADMETLVQYPGGLAGDYEIPSSVITLRESAFIGCSKLTGVTLPDYLERIEQYCFSNCRGLTSIRIPESVVYIGEKAFGQCVKLGTIYCDPTTPPTLGADVFYELPSSYVIYVPEAALSDYQAAPGWADLNVQVKGANITWKLTDGVLTISGTGEMVDYALYYETPWYSVQESITSVVIEDGITRIGNSAFKFCSNVASVAIPNSVISIGEYAFYACAMNSLIIPDNVETIEGYAFSNCYSLSTVTIGSGVKSIGQQAFEYDEALAVVTCNAMTPPTLDDESVFYDVSSSFVIYVPEAALSDYQAAPVWKDLNVHAQGLPVPEIKDGKLTAYEGEATNTRLPINGLYMDEYGRHQYIIPEEVLVNMKDQTVYGLKYYSTKNSASTYTSTVDVYLKVVANAQFFLPLEFAEKDAADIVYTGTLASVVNAKTGKAELQVVFDKPFTYTGGNLLIGFDNTTKGEWSSMEFYGTSVTYDAGVYDYNSTSLDAVINAKQVQFIPMTTFYLMDMPDIIDHEKAQQVIDLIDAIGTPITLDSEAAIVAARAAYDALTDAQKALVTNYATLTDAEAALAELKDNTAPHDLKVEFKTGGAVISWQGTFDTYDLRMDKRANLSKSTFENGLDGWRSIDADGDGYGWEWKSQSGDKFTTHNESAGCVSSASYINDVGKLTPDNWLVSPQVTLGGMMTLWATGQDDKFFAEHFAVYVSTTGNSDPADFTQVSSEYEVETSRDYKLYTVDLSAFSGMGYVAIRHFNCTDLYWLNIDDITITAPDFTWEYDVTGLPANEIYIVGEFFEPTTEYVFQVRGHKGEKVSEWVETNFLSPLAPEDQAAVDAVIGLINAIGTPITLDSEAAIVAARAAYDALKPALQKLISNYSVLQAAEKALANIKGNIPLITDGWVHYDDAEYHSAVGGVTEIYWGIRIPANTVTSTTLTKVSLYLRLAGDYTVTIYSGGATPAEGTELYTETVNLTKENEWNEVELASPVTVDPAQDIWVTFYTNLGTNYPATDCAKANCSNARWISIDGTTWEDVYDLLEDEVAWMIRAYFGDNADEKAAEAVIDLINAIGTPITLDSEALIVAARSAYDALTEAQKALIDASIYKILTDAEAQLADLKQKAEADRAAANIVIAKINAIGEVTLSSEPLIVAAREAYDALTEDQKALIDAPTYKILTDAEAALADLKAQAEADQKAANVIIDLINAIGTPITLDSEAAIVAARTAYNTLTDAQKALVTNYDVLTDAEATLEILKKQAEGDEAAAQAVVDLINAIGEVTYSPECYNKIRAARTAYDALTDGQKALIDAATYKILTDAEARYAELKAQAEAIENAKVQLMALVSEAAELKAVATIYMPSATTEIDAIIENAQITLNDPNATVEEINAKAEIIRGDIQLVAAALLEEAKEQLRQSIKALYLPTDYPSWYAEVIIPALNQIDAMMWDNDKTVQENIMIFQAAGQTLYNDVKAALEALRASDTRTIVSSCEFAGFTGAIRVGMTWNASELISLVSNLNTSAASQPYHFSADESLLIRWNEEGSYWEGVDHYAGEVLVPGKYQFSTAIYIDGDDAKLYRFPKTTEEVLTVSVDGEAWTVSLTGITIDATYSFTYVESPEFILSSSEDIENIRGDAVKAQKIFHNGHIFILRDGKIFTIQGTLVK